MTPEVKERIEQIRHGIVPEGYKKTAAGIIPTEWKAVRIGDICAVNPPRSKTPDEKVTFLGMADVSEEGRLINANIVDHTKVSKGFTAFEKGDILVAKITPCFENGKGANTRCMPTNQGFGSTEFHVLRGKEITSGYLFLHTISYNFRKKLESEMTGSAGQKRVQTESLSSYLIGLPGVDEQNRIFEILNTQDQVIEKQQEKIEEYLKAKKYLQRMLFPMRTQDIPTLRFKKFTSAWEQREFSKQYEKVSEKNDLSFGTDKIISVANMYFRGESTESSDEYMRTYNIMRLGDIAFEGNRSKYFANGRFVENTIGDGIVSHVFDVFRPIVDYDLLFWKYVINDEAIMGRILKRCTKASTMMTNLVAKDFLKEKIAVPSIAEQRQIGSFLNTMDRLIELHQRKLELEKLKKKALMQLLLTGIVRV